MVTMLIGTLTRAKLVVNSVLFALMAPVLAQNVTPTTSSTEMETHAKIVMRPNALTTDQLITQLVSIVTPTQRTD